MYLDMNDVFSQAAFLINALGLVVGVAVGLSAGMMIVQALMKLAGFSVSPSSDKTSSSETADKSQPQAPEPETPQPPSPTPPPRIPGWVWEDIATLVEYARIVMKPANCPSCGAALPADSRTCQHCGTTV